MKKGRKTEAEETFVISSYDVTYMPVNDINRNAPLCDVTRIFAVVFLNPSSPIQGYLIKVDHGCVPYSCHIRT